MGHCDHLVDALLEVLRDDGRERDVARLAALDHDATKPQPGARFRTRSVATDLPAHAGVAEDEKNCDVAGAPALARGPDTPAKVPGVPLPSVWSFASQRSAISRREALPISRLYRR